MFLLRRLTLVLLYRYALDRRHVDLLRRAVFHLDNKSSLRHVDQLTELELSQIDIEELVAAGRGRRSGARFARGGIHRRTCSPTAGVSERRRIRGRRIGGSSARGLDCSGDDDLVVRKIAVECDL